MNEFYSRTALLVGEDSVARLRSACVAVVGVGGVGSFAAEALARSGVGHILLVDNDIIVKSNLNRQLHSLTSTLGQYKTDAMQKRLMDINPEIKITTIKEFILKENATDIFCEKIDYIIDAVDTITAKISIIEEALQRNVPIISCMGAGNKLDPTLFEVADIYSTSVCPLCRVIRRELKSRDIKSLEVVYSKEQPRPSTTFDPKRANRSIPGSISFVPSVAGLIAAGVVIRKLADIKPA